jgi:hypothetical protein
MQSKTAVFMAMLAVSMSLTLAPPVSAQMAMSAPELRGVFKPVVGAGAGYEFVKTDGQKTHFDITIVDKDPGGGYWTEYSIADPHSKGTVYMKMLVSQRADDVAVEHMIMQIPGQPPMDMSAMMQGMGGMGHPKQNQKIDIRAQAQDLGAESVTTPAGTFSCQHWRTTQDGTDVWISDKVTPWGLVKMSEKDGSSMTLARLITDAKTHITGTPVSMEEMMKGMGKQ